MDDLERKSLEDPKSISVVPKDKQVIARCKKAIYGIMCATGFALMTTACSWTNIKKPTAKNIETPAATNIKKPTATNIKKLTAGQQVVIGTVGLVISNTLQKKDESTNDAQWPWGGAIL